jgi:hypothetical protein
MGSLGYVYPFAGDARTGLHNLIELTQGIVGEGGVGLVWLLIVLLRVSWLAIANSRLDLYPAELE